MKSDSGFWLSPSNANATYHPTGTHNVPLAAVTSMMERWESDARAIRIDTRSQVKSSDESADSVSDVHQQNGATAADVSPPRASKVRSIFD